MKTMGKWTVTLFMITLLAGCYGGGSSSSSDEGPISARQHPTAGTWKVTLNPRGESITIEPVTLAAKGYPIGITYSQAALLTDSNTVALHNRMVAKSEVVCSATMGSSFTCGATKFDPTTDYVIVLNADTSTPTIPSTIARTPGSTIPNSTMVYVSYKYFKCNNCQTMDLSFDVYDEGSARGEAVVLNGVVPTALAHQNLLGAPVPTVYRTDIPEADDDPAILAGTTPVTLSHTNILSMINVCDAIAQGGTCFTQDTDYTMDMVAGTIVRIDGAGITDPTTVYVTYTYSPPAVTPADYVLDLVNGTLARTVASTIPNPGTVFIDYMFPSVSYSDDGGNKTTTANITIKNSTNLYWEELRAMIGGTSGPGLTATLRNSDYPLIGGATSDRPNILTTQPVDGWNSGQCYTTGGAWADYLHPVVQGCETIPHPANALPYMTQWMDPVCGKLSETWKFSGSQSQYVFYMQLTGNNYPWEPDTGSVVTPDARWNKTYYPTYYAQLAYLVPTSAALDTATTGGACAGADAARKAYWDGAMSRVKADAAETNRCGTLITNPHLAPGTYFALNLGLEYPDYIETKAGTFWSTYAAVAAKNIYAAAATGTPYYTTMMFEILLDPGVLQTFSSPAATPNGTVFPGGFTRLFTGASTLSQSTKPWSHAKWQIDEPASNSGAYFYSSQNTAAGAAAGAFEFFKAPSTAPFRTFMYISESATEYCGGTGNSMVNFPYHAGMWGVAHYELNGALYPKCKLVTEGADADIDFWFGMMVMKVRRSTDAVPLAGDWSYIRFDQTANNFMKLQWNNKTASNLTTGGVYEDPGTTFCFRKGTVDAPPVCPGTMDNSDLLINGGKQVGNPSLPPGIRSDNPAWNSDVCPKGKNTCGGNQYVVGVVCVQ